MPSRRQLFGQALVAGGGGPTLSGRFPGGGETTVYVDTYVEPASADDGPAIRRAIADAVNSGRMVAFSGREYHIGSTIDLPTGIHLVGVGAVDGPGPSATTGTVLRRVRECVMLQAHGKSFRVGGPMRHSIALRDILFAGGDYATDLVQFISVSRIEIDNCFFLQSKGRLLLLWEVFDSRITNTDFEWGGSAEGDVPMIELRSGGALDYTNHVHFVGCRCESYPATAIAVTGVDANKIFFTNCKLESLASNFPALTMTRAVMVHFSGLQITGRGTPGAQIDGFIKARDCFGIMGDVSFEYQAWESAGARLASYIDLGRAKAVDLTLCMIDGLRPLPPEDYVSFDTRNSVAVTVRGYFRDGDSAGRHEWRA